MKKRIFEISEKHERIVIRRKQKRSSAKSVCPDCGKEVEWLSLEETSALVSGEIEEIRLAIAGGSYDTQKSVEGEILVCSESVLKKIN